MLAFDADRLEETWWDGLGLVKHAWADDKDDEDDDDEADDKDKDKNKGKNNNKNKNKNGGGGLGWQGYADPIGGRPRHFYTDQTKTITFAIGRRATRYDSLLGNTYYPHKDSSSGSQKSGRGNPAGLPY